jgi:hypothetical protein
VSRKTQLVIVGACLAVFMLDVPTNTFAARKSAPGYVLTAHAWDARFRGCGRYPGASWYSGRPDPIVYVLRGSVSCARARRVLVAAETKGIHLERVGGWWCFGPPVGTKLPNWNERCGSLRSGRRVTTYRDFYGSATKFKTLLEL